MKDASLRKHPAAADPLQPWTWVPKHLAGPRTTTIDAQRPEPTTESYNRSRQFEKLAMYEPTSRIR
ncbi:hypothetical protein FRAAL3066 [Frankia alni ACN14a]|uniref:Uncharacterized protein n=1 Tax=Frankia alni (strain DSM 45986 / CECT 9034 / ACN14a) TaxID=326424 RepID=Q0RL95_FRAAA|nr:hypothetical protein FRAAL3066 [Frankia alni ACN14a]